MWSSSSESELDWSVKGLRLDFDRPRLRSISQRATTLIRSSFASRSGLLKDTMKTSAFDVWLSLQVKDPRTGQFTQTEQLARPGVNEALLVSQPKLAAYNRLEPTRTVTPVLAGIATEAKQTLLALGNSDTRANALLGAFLPDVMRIDTTGASGYANALNAKGAPIRGRLLKDDVIDITLSVLTNGGVTTDNVSYEGASGNPGQGHQPLVTSFPYLAPPN